LKEALRPLLPPGVLQRKKQGFGVPLGTWFRGSLTTLFSDVLGSAGARTRGYFDRRVVERLVREHTSGVRDHSMRLWQLVMFELWHREYLDGPVAGSSAAHLPALPFTRAR